MNRLGTSGPQEVKNHPWLKDFQWEKLKKKELRAPFLPNVFFLIINIYFLIISDT